MKKRAKKSKHIDSLILIIVISLILFVAIFGDGSYTSYLIFSSITQSDFDEGTYNNTFFNTSIGGVQLNATFTSGTHTSKIFNAGGPSQWLNISWIQEICYQCGLPNNQKNDTGNYIRLANMTGNVLLFHFDNDSSIGETTEGLNNWTIDSSGNVNNGSIFGATFNKTGGKFGGAFEFDGSNDIIITSINDDSFAGKNLTITAWAKLRNLNPSNNILIVARQESTLKKNFQVGLEIDNKLLFSTYDTCAGSAFTLYSPGTLSTNTWYHVAFVLEHNIRKDMYINGELVANHSNETSVKSGCGQKTSIGANTRNPGTTSWNGTIDEVAIYNRPLTASEILDHYKRGALRLNLSVRSCDDSACLEERFIDINDTSPQNISIANNTYFQYKVEFRTDNATYSPQIYNATIDYQRLNDTTLPRINASLDNSTPVQNQIVNMTANVSDNFGLSFCQFIDNQSLANGAKTFFNKTVTGTNDQCSQNYTIRLAAGNVINFTVRANDTSNNFRTNDTIITVASPAADTTPPGVNITNFNSSDTIRINNRLNISCQSFDSATRGNITFNLSGPTNLYNFSFTLIGASTNYSQNITVNLTRNNVINATCWASDAAGNVAQNSTLITVANTPPSQATILFPTNNLFTKNQPLELNVTFAADADNDAVNISYYIDGKLNQTSLVNTTLNASDGSYILNVSLSDNIAGSAPSANVTVNFTIDTITPVIALISPANNAASKENISFSYNVTDAFSISNCSLIINKNINQTNNPIINGTKQYFNLSNLPALQYNWSINCSDNANNIGSSEERSISTVLVQTFNGSTTDLTTVDIKNITNFTIENTIAGKINFTQSIDLSGGGDLNKYVNISFNKIEINSTALSALNKSAILQLYGLTSSNPRILRDNVACPIDICKKISYSGGILIFNVTQFTSYSSEETPAEAQPAPSVPSGGAGGGGGGGGAGAGGGGGAPPAVPVITDFSVDKTILKVVLKQDETKKETLSIKNTGTTIFEVKANFEGIKKFKVYPEADEIAILLNPNEEKIIELVFKALENEKPDIYTGKIILKSPSIEREVATVIEVNSAQPLFDIDTNIISADKKVFPGEELLLEVNLFNVRGFGRVDIAVEYTIKDLNDNLIISEHETLAVETEAKFTRALLIPNDLKPGTYVAFAKVVYGEYIGTSSDLFEVQAKTIKLSLIQLKDYRIALAIGAGALLIIILIFSAYKFGYLKKKVPTTPAEEVKQIKEEEKVEKLRKELQALGSAYKSGFISEESYKKNKERIKKTKYNKNTK